MERARRALTLLVAVTTAAALTACSDRPPTDPRAAHSTADDLVDAAAKRVADLLTGARAQLSVLAQVPEVRGDDATACSERMADLYRDRAVVRQRYTAFGAARANGDLFCLSSPPTSPVNISDREYFRRAIDQGDFAVGDYQVGRVTGKASIGLGLPVQEGDRTVGIVLAPVDLGWLGEDLAAGVKLPTGAELVLVDSKGTVLVHLPSGDRVGEDALHEPLVGTMRNSVGSTSVRGLDGVERTYAFRAVAGADGHLRIAVGIRTASA